MVWRTNQSNVSFDSLRVTGSPASYNTLVYLHGDHLGSIGAVTNSSGALLDMTRFYPFGGFRGSDPAFLTERGFTGHKANNTSSNDLGLIYMNARYYVGEIGRFASADTLIPDPNDPQALNRYAYARNNPLRYTDPTGHCFFAPPIDLIFCMTVGVLVVDHFAGTPHESALEANPYSAPIEGPPNVISASDKMFPNISAGDGIGAEVEVNTYYHLGSDTYATVGCMCVNIMTPNAGANASFSIAWTEANNASQVAEGIYGSANVGLGPFGLGKSIALSPVQTEKQTNDFWKPQAFSLAPPPSQGPGTTGYSFSFGPSVAPAGVSINTCECSVISAGSFAHINVPWYVNLSNRIYDQYRPD